MLFRKIELTYNIIERFWKYVDKKSDDECWGWLGHKTEDGYGRVSINGRLCMSHRVSWVIHNGDIPNDMCICHKCDNPGCINPAHLFLGTALDNNRDRQNKGRTVVPDNRGEKQGNHKLTEQQVKEIRKKYIPHVYSTNILAKEYNVSNSTIYDVIKYITWAHVLDDL